MPVCARVSDEIDLLQLLIVYQAVHSQEASL